MQPYELAQLIVSLHKRGDTKPKIINGYIEELYQLVDRENAEAMIKQARNAENDRRQRIAMVAWR